MRKKFGTICMGLGAVLILGALFLFLYNQKEDESAGEAASNLMSQMQEEMKEKLEAMKQEADSDEMNDGVEENSQSDFLDNWNIPQELLDEEDLKMETVKIDGYEYIGYLSFPTLGLELPIMSDWDYGRLKIAPCRYYGSVRGENLVLMAHNYKRHFGRIRQLTVGERVVFTDVKGEITQYEVVGVDILEPTSVEEMISGDFDLTLFTCTYGGKSRVTVYCERL